MVFNLGTFVAYVIWLLIFLKIMHVINISWTLIMIPIWISLSIIGCIALSVLFIIALGIMRGV